MSLESSDRVLATGRLVDGRFRAEVDPSVAGLSDWRAPLKLVVTESFTRKKKATVSLGGVTVGGADDYERDVFLIGESALLE